MHIYWFVKINTVVFASIALFAFWSCPLVVFFACMALIVLTIMSLFHVAENIGSSQPSALIYRHQNFDVYYGDFKSELNHYLSETIVASSFVVDTFDCVFKCMEETACYSLNVASYPDVDGLYLCELLDTDKYRSTESDLQEDGDFHHFSPLVSLKLNLINTFLALTV